MNLSMILMSKNINKLKLVYKFILKIHALVRNRTQNLMNYILFSEEISSRLMK